MITQCEICGSTQNNYHKNTNDCLHKKYLLFDKDDYQTRIAKCILDGNIKLNHFKESAVKELYGWINNDNIPLCNDRTLKSMQWLGFGKLFRGV